MKTTFFIFSFVFLTSFLRADLCFDYRLLDGAEEIVDYGMDSTTHWWAITKPFNNRYRLTVDGEELEIVNNVKPPVFSHDSKKWAAFAEDNLGLMLITQDSMIGLNASDFGSIIYSTISNDLVYSFFEGSNEVIIHKNTEVYVYSRTGKIIVSPDGEKIAFMGYRGDKVIVNYDGFESASFDEIKPIGFMDDGNFYYAAANSSNWYIYKNEESVSDLYYSVKNIKMNLDGNVVAYSASLTSGMAVAVMINDEFIDSQWESKRFDEIFSIVLHPYLPLIAFNASYNDTEFIMFNNTKYYGGQSTSVPMFSHDGEDLLYFGCNISCFANLNGHKLPLKNSIDINYQYAFKPGSKSIAYATSSNMVVLFLEDNFLHAGKMLDEVIRPRYNWRDKQYESMGVINNKLYFLTCRMDDE